MKSLIVCFLVTLTGCASADFENMAGAMAGELARQAQTGTGVFTNPYANVPPVQQIAPYRCVSKRNPTGAVVTECR